MTQEQYTSFLIGKLNEDVKSDIDVITIMRVLLEYNRRLIKDRQGDFDSKFDEKYLDILSRANKAKIKKDDKTIDSLSKDLFEFCDNAISDLFKSGKTSIEGLHLVHRLVVENESTEKKENIREARVIADLSLKNNELRKEYIAEKNKVEQNNFVLYDDATFDSLCERASTMKKEDLIKRLESVILADTRHFTTVENKYIPNIVEEIVKEDVRLLCPANDTKLKVS